MWSWETWQKSIVKLEYRTFQVDISDKPEAFLGKLGQFSPGRVWLVATEAPHFDKNRGGDSERVRKGERERVERAKPVWNELARSSIGHSQSASLTPTTFTSYHHQYAWRRW